MDITIEITIIKYLIYNVLEVLVASLEYHSLLAVMVSIIASWFISTFSSLSNQPSHNNNQYFNTSLLPSRAIQNITLKRITSDNISSADIIGNLNNG